MDNSTLFPLYESLGWKLCPIPAGLKHPTGEGWNASPFMAGLPPGWAEMRGGAGLMHAFSGTCAVDIDQLEASLWVMPLSHGIDVQGLFDAPGDVQVLSPKLDTAKLLYRLPEGLVLPTVTWTHGGRHMFQLRCMTKSGKSVQDVLPRTPYPGTAECYEWGGKGDFRHLPMIPWDLLARWLEEARLIAEEGGEFRDITSGNGRGNGRGNDRSQAGPVVLDEQELRKIRAALEVLNPDMGRDDWLRVGMALHAADPNVFGLWDEWSRGGKKYANDPAQPRPEDIWSGFGQAPGPQVELATLYHLADKACRENPLLPHWRRATIDVQALLQPNPAPQTPGDPPGPIPASDPVSAHQPEAADPLERGLPTYQELLQETLSVRPMDDLRPYLVKALGLTPTEQDRIITSLADNAQINKAALRRELGQLEAAHRAQTDAETGRGVPEVLRPLFSAMVHVGQLGVFFHAATRSYYKPQQFEQAFCHLHEQVLERALHGGVRKVDRLDYLPGEGALFEERGVSYVNLWSGLQSHGIAGDCSVWLKHFEVLGLEPQETRHLLQWMAYTLRYPGRKINHGVVLSGPEGVGKDALFYPLDQAFGDDATVMDAVSLFSDFNAEILGCKLLRLNETALGGDSGSRRIEEKLKPMLATPPERVWVNQKGLAKFQVRNVFNVAILSNSHHPLHISPTARRYFTVRTELDMRDEDGNLLPEWRAYWRRYWHWIKEERGWEACVRYLMEEVDLADFDPGLAPPMTAFTREIQEDSRTDIEAAILDLIDTREGVFSAPVITAHDIQQMFAFGRQSNVYVQRYGLGAPPGAREIGRAMKHGRLARIHKSWGPNRRTGRRAMHRLLVLEEPPGWGLLNNPQRVELYNLIISKYWSDHAGDNVTPFR